MQDNQERVLLRKQDRQGANIEITTDQHDHLHVYADGVRTHTQRNPDPNQPTRRLTPRQAQNLGLEAGATALGPVHLTRSETETLQLTWSATSTRVSDHRLATQRRALRLRAIVLADALPSLPETHAHPGLKHNQKAMLQEFLAARQQLIDWDRDHPEFLSRHPTLARHTAHSILPTGHQHNPAPGQGPTPAGVEAPRPRQPGQSNPGCRGTRPSSTGSPSTRGDPSHSRP